MQSFSRACSDLSVILSFADGGCSTGYELVKEVNKRTFGEDVIDRISDGWGLDAECEIQGAYRPTGHPAVSHSFPIKDATMLRLDSSGTPSATSSVAELCPSNWCVRVFPV